MPIPLKDPLNRTLFLHDHTWDRHILKGHPEMAGKRHQVENTLQHPTEIHFSAADPDCRVYYASLPGSRLNVVVVADVARGWVKTAFLARKIKQGTVEWSR